MSQPVVKIVYASMTGNTEEIAEIINDEFEKANADVEMMTSDSASPEDFDDADICVVATYTYDEGDVPDDIIDFYDDLADVQLDGKIYGVAGSGDTFYEFFCKAVDDFDARFTEVGAVKGADNVKVELAPEEDDIKHLETFVASLMETYNNQ